MAPTQEIECEYVYDPPPSITITGVVDVIPGLPNRNRPATPIRAEPEEELVAINPYDSIEIPFLPNLRDILRNATGSDNLEEVSLVKLKVIAHEVGLQHLSVHLPTLRELILDGSVVSSLRDLGCGLKSLKVLKVNRCGLKSLDGVYGVKNLVELHAASNRIEDLTACTSLASIKYVNVKRNKLRDINALSFLAVCESLEHLVLDDNPHVSDFFDYRERVKRLIPTLKMLDGVEYDEEENDENTLVSTSSRADNKAAKLDKKEVSLPPIKTKSPSPKLNQPSAAGPSRSCYSVSFSPKVLSPREDSNEESRSRDIKVHKTEFPKI